MDNLSILVTGTSSGFGLLIARTLLAQSLRWHEVWVDGDR